MTINHPSIDIEKIKLPKAMDFRRDWVFAGLESIGYSIPSDWAEQNPLFWPNIRAVDAEGKLYWKDSGREISIAYGNNELLLTEFSEAIWDALDWGQTAFWAWTDGGTWTKHSTAWSDNRRPGVTSAEEPKPTWKQVKAAVFVWWIEGLPSYLLDSTDEHDMQGIDREISSVSSAKLLEPAQHPQSGSPLLVREGISHLSSLICTLTGPAAAGRERPRAVFLAESGVADLWTENDVVDLVRPLADRKNAIETARNLMREEARRIALVIKDPDGGAGANATPEAKFNARAAATDRLTDLIDTTHDRRRVEANFDALLEKVESEGNLPDDLPRVQAILVERLEAAAMARTKAIKGAKSQQGVDVSPTCDDMANALREVAQECAIGAQDISDAEPTLWKKAAGKWAVTTETSASPEHGGPDGPDDATGADGEFYLETGVADAKSAFDAAAVKIAAVTAINTPEWEHQETTILGHQVTVQGKHPDGASIPGRVLVTSLSAFDGNGNQLRLPRVVTRPGGGARVQVQATIARGTAYPIKFHVIGRNLCGDSSYAFEVSDPSRRGRS